MNTAIIQVIILFILLALSAFFSSSETALTTVSKVSLKSMSEEGDHRADVVLDVLDNYSRMLSTILICNNIVNLSSSALTTSMIIRVFGANWVSIGTAILTVAVILFGEITPKNIATIRAQELALSVAPIIRFLMKILTPIVIVIDFLADGILRIAGIDKNQRRLLTENELRTYVEVGREDGAIEGREKKLIYNVFDFGDSVAKDIMTPRIDMLCISIDATYEEVLSAFRQEMFTRLPVYDTEPDHIIGMINIKDFIMLGAAPIGSSGQIRAESAKISVRSQSGAAIAREPRSNNDSADSDRKRETDRPDFHVKDLLRDAYYTYEYKKTADLLKEMQSRYYNIAFVLDEYGLTVGMVTLEDLVEEIVGEIRDEYDEEEIEQIHKYDDRTFLVEGSMSLDDVNDALGCNLESEDYDSIGGLMIESLERLPVNNEIVHLESGITLQCKGIRRNRIVKVLLRFPEPPENDEFEDAPQKQDKDAGQSVTRESDFG